MGVSVRKKSPRAPSVSLSEALDRALKAYENDRLHPAPIEVFAQNLGYKSANNGAALTMLASLRYYGLAERPADGMLAITKDVESYKFAPEVSLKKSLVRQFLRSPNLYSELLDKYASGLPSDANLRYELIQRGFAPSSAESALLAFRESVEFAEYFQDDGNKNSEESVQNAIPDAMSLNKEAISPAPQLQTQSLLWEDNASQDDTIPVRLPGGRRAWLRIPTPFFAADRDRLKAQIDLLLTQDEENLD